MAVKLRTRLFLVIGGLLAASVLVSAILSRQLTLVEVREFVTTSHEADDPTSVLDRAASAVSELEAARLASALAALEETSARRIVVFDESERIIAASNEALVRARTSAIKPDGTFVGAVRMGDTEAAITIRGAPTRAARNSRGAPVWILVLPAMNEQGLALQSPSLPGWVWTTAATVIVAVPLVFAVSRRILGPVSAITAAARRMRAGDLGVKVEVRGEDELAELARAFNEMSLRLQENERVRKQMVSDVAHELRSPVTNLRCTLEAVQDGLVAPDRTSIDALHEETLFLQRLIADLEELALADAGQLTMARARVDLGALLRRVSAGVHPIDGAAITVDAPADLPDIEADADRLEQVFRNLLANARTHTPPDGRILVSAGHDGTTVWASVTDTGSGIEPAHLPHVFDRFYRADRSRTRATGGAGLGLAIARQLVSAHRGTLTAQSEGVGKGAAFTVRLPRSS